MKIVKGKTILRYFEHCFESLENKNIFFRYYRESKEYKLEIDIYNDNKNEFIQKYYPLNKFKDDKKMGKAISKFKREVRKIKLGKREENYGSIKSK